MASGSSDLFVVCKHCGAEVSPYITECPYCGNRIQKRAPKLDKAGQITIKPARPSLTPNLPRLRRGEIPGIRHDSHPYTTGVLVVLGFLGALVLRTGWIDAGNLIAYGQVSPHPWRVITSTFIYFNTGYAVITLATIAVFGWLLERRHGPFLVLALAIVGGVGGTFVSLQLPANIVSGGNGIALAFVTAWALPDLVAWLTKEDFEGDLIGVAVLFAVIALMPIFAPEASWISDVVGVAAGILIGYPVARLRPV